MVEYLQKTLSK